MFPKTLATLACLSLVGTAGGVWLGGAAVGEIDPFFFSTPESTFVTDRVAYRSPDWAEVQIGEYQQQGLVEGIGQGPVAGAVYAAPAVASYGESWAEAAEEQAVQPRAWAPRQAPRQARARTEEPVRVWTIEEAPAEQDPEWQRVERYASYVVAEEEPEEEAPAPEPMLYAAAQETGAE